jgi:hypothetical protein
LEHYERAVERETQGNLGESMRHYRIAFKVRLSFSILERTCCLTSSFNRVYDDANTYSSSSTMASTKPTNANTSRHHHSSSQPRTNQPNPIRPQQHPPQPKPASPRPFSNS